MKGTRPGHHPQPSKRAERASRPCEQPGCDTRLSAYNLGTHCWQHTELTFPNYRGKRLADGRA